MANSCRKMDHWCSETDNYCSETNYSSSKTDYWRCSVSLARVAAIYSSRKIAGGRLDATREELDGTNAEP
jgi:hypothetical protein